MPWAVGALLLVHAVLALWAVAGKSTTADEILHVTAGYSYWTNHDYRLHPENGILPQRWAAIPTAIEQPPFPALKDNPYWKTSEIQAVGHQFFYETGHDHFPMLMGARAMIVLFNLGTGILIFYWSRKLFGTAGGFVSLALFTFSPTFLAHGVLATSDACMTFFFLASVAAWWKTLHDGRARWWWLSALTFGLAWVAKYSAPLLIPMMVLMALARAWTAEPLIVLGRTFTTRGGKFGAAAGSAVGHGLVAMAVIWAFYGFRYAAFNPALPPPDGFIRPWEVLDMHIGFPGQVLRFAEKLRVLPEAFLYGFAYVLETTQVRSAFLNGEYSTTGWPSFFPWTFALKSTLPELLATGLVVVLVARRWLRDRAKIAGDVMKVAPLAALFVVYWASSLQLHLNIGHRHIMPTYPVLFIAAGMLGAWLVTRRALLVGVAAVAVGGQVIEAAGSAPNYLAYFNALGGGPENGHRHLVDSSLDWGQDLPGLKTWLEANVKKDEPIFLSYFGTGEPDYYRIPARRLPFVNAFKLKQPLQKLEPGYYCISATMLEHVYSSIRGDWTLEYEKEYQQLRALEPLYLDYARDPVRRAEMNRDASEAQWRRSWTRYDVLRLARLCYYLRVRKPEANIGYSIFIYRLSAEEIAAATAGSLREWNALIERTAKP